MTDRPDNVDLLTQRLAALEQRVYVLEHPSQVPPLLTLPEQAQPVLVQPALPQPALPQPAVAQVAEQASGAFAVLGKAMLGIAGAYVLRAVAESSLLPRPLAAGIAIAYAIAWLVAAARLSAGAWFTGLAYAGTSAVILAPMLWELTLNFKVLSPLAAAIALAAFIGAAFALGWKHEQRAVLWTASITAAAVAVSLSIATHVMTPFLVLLLLMVAFGEFSAACGHVSGTRILVALATDLALWTQIYIYSSPRSAHPDYPTAGVAALLAPSLLLCLILTVSVVRTCIVQGQAIPAFETVQAVVAFLLATCAWLYFGPANAALIFGVICLGLSVASYAAVFLLFVGDEGRRNAVVFGWWSAALLLTASLFCLPAYWQAPWLSVVAIAAVSLGERRSRPALEWHGLAYLLVAVAVSGLTAFTYGALVGSVPGNAGIGIYLTAISAALCAALQRPRPDDHWSLQLLHLVFEVLAVVVLAALLAQGLAALVELRLIPAAHHLALIRTLTLCASALGLAIGGARMARREMTRMSYAILVLVAAKLIVEDLRSGRLEYTAASIFLFAVTLIAVSRSTRKAQQT